ncbi:MAG TPA: hypothetical protein VFE53_03245, partial [Mucilaginibacter sp.]|nr:hypothetical protein [Mucilaginibacter sp.]
MKTIEYAVKGSLDSAAGEAGIISCTPQILNDNRLLSDVTDLDGILTTVLRSYDESTNEHTIQKYCISKQPQHTGEWKKAILRGVINFSRFKDSNRTYNRREFYFVNEDEFDFYKLFQDLPGLSPIFSTSNGSKQPIVISPWNQDQEPIDTELLYRLMEGFLTSRPFAIDAEEARLLKTIDQLPSAYKKMIQFGLNLSLSDSLVQERLHFFTPIKWGLKPVTMTRDTVLEQIADGMVHGHNLLEHELPPFFDGDRSTQRYLFNYFRMHYVLIAGLLVKDEEAFPIKFPDFPLMAADFIKTYSEFPNMERSFTMVYDAVRRSYRHEPAVYSTFLTTVFGKVPGTQNKYLLIHVTGIIGLLTEALTAERLPVTFENLNKQLNTIFPQANKRYDPLKNRVLAEFLKEQKKIRFDDLKDFFSSNNGAKELI